MKNLLLILSCCLFYLNSTSQQISFYYTSTDTLYFSSIQDESSLEFQIASDTSNIDALSCSYSRLREKTYKVEMNADSLANSLLEGVRIYPAYLNEYNRVYYLTSEIIVCFNEDVDSNQIQQLQSFYDLELVQNNSYYNVYRCDNPFLACQGMFISGLVKSCEPNFYYQLELASHVPNDEYFEKQFYLRNTGQELNDGQFGDYGQDIKVTDAWELTTGHFNARIMLIDASGIQIGHPDLPEYKIVRNNIFGSGLNQDTNNTTSVAHGQCCAGILVAEMDNNEGISGIAPRCTIIPVVTGGFTSTISQLDIYNWIATLDNATKPDVVSCSYVPVSSEAHRNAIEALSDDGIIFCFAAGNVAQHSENCDGNPVYSVVSQCSNVLIVGATSAQGNATDYSGFGSWVDIAAPSATDIDCGGSGNCEYSPNLPNQLPNIWTTDIVGELGYNGSFNDTTEIPWFYNCTPQEYAILPSENLDYTGRFFGTSAATPQVAGVISLMKSANSCLSMNQFFTILRETADQTGNDVDGNPYNYYHDPERPGHSIELGYGRLDAFEAVQAALTIGDFNFTIQIFDEICGEEESGEILVHFPSNNASLYSLELEFPPYMEFDAAPSISIEPEANSIVPNLGNRPYLLKVTEVETGCTSVRQFWIFEETTLEIEGLVLDQPCLGDEICPTVSGGTEPYSFEWFDGTTESCVTPMSNGIYNLNVTDAEGCVQSTNSPLEMLSVSNYPANTFIDESILFNSLCNYAGYSIVEFSNLTTYDGALFNWNFGDGQFSELQNPSHIYQSAGNYAIELTIEIPNCETYIIQTEINIVTSNFENSIIVDMPCQNFTNSVIIFEYINPTPQTTYTWDFGDGTSGFSTISNHVYDVAGTYNVSLTISINGCNPIVVESQSEITIVEPNFENNINMIASCLNLPNSAVVFEYADAEPQYSYLWNFGDGASETAALTNHLYSQAGVYTVSLSISFEGCDPIIIESQIEIENFDYPSDLIVSNPSGVASIFSANSTYGGDIIFTANPNQYIISNTTLYLSEQTDIIIQEGASVIFNNCILTSCGTWNGINVESNSDSPTTAGRLSFDPNGNSVSTIEFARIAIESFDSRLNANSTVVSNLQAGYITCNRTVFRNNAVSVSLRNAKMQIYIPAAGFTRCTFTVNDEMKEHFIDNSGDYNSFLYHVQSNRMLGYNFKGCSFKNEMTADTHFGQWKNRGIGIYSHSSRFNIDKATTTQVGVEYLGSFEGLDRGISTGKGISNLRISNQAFKKNHIGIFLSGAAYCRVYTNTFRIGEATGLTELDNQLTYGTFPGNSLGIENNNGLSYEGLVIQKGDFHEIAENTFNGYRSTEGGVSDDYARIGVRIRATNTEEMVVRKNSFSRLSFANLANGDNAGGTSTSGLRFICNTNSQNTQDFTNTDFLGVANSATVSNVQFEPFGTFPISIQATNWPTGNTFSSDSPSTATHFRNEGISIQSYWHSDVVNQTPTDFSGVNSTVVSFDIHSCPAVYGSNHTITSHAFISARIAEGNVARLEAEEYRYLYLLLIDGGDTEALQNFVENTWGIQVWTTREELMTISPFVSEEVIYSLLDETITYPHAMAFEIIAANPELLRNPKLVSYLSEKNDPMPEYMIELLMLYNQQSTERSDIEKTMGEKRTQHISKVSEALWGMLDYEDYTFSQEDYRAVLADMKVLNSEFFIINDLLDEGALSSALQRVNAIPQTIPLRNEERYEYMYFVEWVNWRNDLELAGRDLETLTSTDLQNLEPIADAFDTFASSLAISILNEEKDTAVFTPPALGKSATQYKSRVFALANFANSTASLSVYPNPANYLVQVELNEPEILHCDYTLYVIDLLGQTIHTVISSDGMHKWLLDTTQWSNGVYTIKVLSSNGIEISEILNVAH